MEINLERMALDPDAARQYIDALQADAVEWALNERLPHLGS